MRAVAVTLFCLVPVFLGMSFVIMLLKHGEFASAVVSFAAAAAGVICFVAAFCFEFAYTRRRARQARLAARQAPSPQRST
ncbi:hypothetical protein ABZW18_06440 [Streptomyces sp. NPDC004647]|uniref:hypothetical protein n=1 Tax=Streptomyces sp. NPDC004647 TaxID=3154671 RepID=UPI0033BED3BF